MDNKFKEIDIKDRVHTTFSMTSIKNLTKNARTL